MRYRLWRARGAIQDRDFERAITWLEQAERLDGNRSEVSLLRARLARRLGELDQTSIRAGSHDRLQRRAVIRMHEPVTNRLHD